VGRQSIERTVSPRVGAARREQPSVQAVLSVETHVSTALERVH